MSDQEEKPEDERGSMAAALRLLRDMKKDTEEYERLGDREGLVRAFKNEFMASRHFTASRTEEARAAATSVLLGRFDKMSDNMLLKVITELSRVSEKDVEGITGIHQRGGPVLSLNQFIGQNNSPSQSLPPPKNEDGSRTNPVQASEQILEAIQHLSAHFAAKRLEASKTPELDIIDAEATEIIER